jgi:hypothetical protein
VIRPQDPNAAHEVVLLCNCGDVERCRTEIYASDVRLAYTVVGLLERRLAQTTSPGGADAAVQP